MLSNFFVIALLPLLSIGISWIAFIIIVPPKRKDKYHKYKSGSEDEHKLKEWASVLTASKMVKWLVLILGLWFASGFAVAWAIWS